MQSQFGTFPHAYTDTVRCAKCGACGVTNWDVVQTKDGSRKDFAGISGSFYERISNRPPYNIELVCTCCDTPASNPQIQLLL
jgi:hypothetical protein